MRKIKFRGWEKEKKIMIYDINLFNGDCGYFDAYPKYNGYVSLRNCKIMQYIGIKDKNDKEIYEGDIIKNNVGIQGVIEFIEKLAYDTGGAIHPGYYCKNFLYDGDLDYYNDISNTAEVIGNIYENQNLIQKIKE